MAILFIGRLSSLAVHAIAEDNELRASRRRALTCLHWSERALVCNALAVLVLSLANRFAPSELLTSTVYACAAASFGCAGCVVLSSIWHTMQSNEGAALPLYMVPLFE